MTRKPASYGLLGALFCFLGGCGDDPPPIPPPPAPTPPPVASVALPQPVIASARPSASAALSAIPIGSVANVTAEPRKWVDFGGPAVPPELDPSKPAWAVVPVSVGWETLRFTTLSVVRVEQDLAVFKVPVEIGKDDPKVEVFVPGAFTRPTQRAEGLKKSDVVMASGEGTRVFGRVLELDGKDNVKVRYRFAGVVEEKSLPLTDVIKLDGTLKFGAPIGYKEVKEGDKIERKTTWHSGQFVHAAEDKTWIVTSTGRPRRLASVDVKPLAVHLSHKAGDKVWAGRGEDLLPSEIVEVLGDGIAYKVKLDTEETTANLETVTAPLK